MDAILEARNARTAAAARGRAVSVVDPLPFDACGDRRALVINALDDVLEKRFLDTVRAPFRTLVDEGVAPGRFARVPLVDGPPCRELLASADLRTCARSTHVCQLPRVDDVENTFAVRHYGGVVTYTFNQCARRDTSDAFRGALRRSTIDFMKRVGAATPEASLADVLDGADCAHVRCLRPSRHLHADLRAARVVFAARAAAAAHPRHALSFDALAGALSEAALAATEDAAPELLAACVLAAVGVDGDWLLGKTAVFFGTAASGGRGPAKGRAGRRPRRRGGNAHRRRIRAHARERRGRGGRGGPRGRGRNPRARRRGSRATAAAGGDPWRRPPPPGPGARAPVGGPRRGACRGRVGGRVARARPRRRAAATPGRARRRRPATRRRATRRAARRTWPRRARPTRSTSTPTRSRSSSPPRACGRRRRATARPRRRPGHKCARRPEGRLAPRRRPPAVGRAPRRGADAARAPRRRRPGGRARLDAGARAAAAGAGLSVRASVGQPLRLAAAAPADAGAWVDAIAAHAAASRQAERDAEAFRRNAPPPDDDTRYFQGREPLFLYRAPSDAAPVVRRLARDAFVEARATVLGDAANFLRTPGGLWARVPAEDAVEVVEGRLFPTSATYVRRRGAAASLVASYPTRLFASAHLLEATTIEASGVFATATGEFLRLADGSGWVPLADEGGERVFFAVPRSL